MKPIIPFALLSAFIAIPASAQGTAVTTPVGYVTETLKASSFNLIGVTLHESTEASGTVTAATASTITDENVDFSALLAAGSTYVLEITSGGGDGVIQDVTSWSGDTLDTPDDISAFVEAGVTNYSIREASTINSIFGEDNESGLLEGSATTADVIWVPNDSGGFDQYFRQPANPPFVPDPIWSKIGGSGDFGGEALIYADGIFVQRRADTDLDLVISGEVKVGATNVFLGGGSFNYVGTTFPVGSTLSNSGLEDSLLSGTATTGDIVWIPDGNGGFDQFFFQPANPPFVPDAQWTQVGASGDAGGTSLTSAVIIQRRGDDGNALLSPPENFDSL